MLACDHCGTTAGVNPHAFHFAPGKEEVIQFEVCGPCGDELARLHEETIRNFLPRLAPPPADAPTISTDLYMPGDGGRAP